MVLPKQATILTHIQTMNARQKQQLVCKFQHAHFLVGKGKSFNLYVDVAKFEKSVLKVDLGESNKIWPILFAMKHELGISNILHMAEICLALPISNPESERVYSFLWRVYSKDHHSLKNNKLEHILRDNDYSIERYNNVIEIFFNQFLNGEVRIGDMVIIIIHKSQKVDEKTVPSMTALNFIV